MSVYYIFIHDLGENQEKRAIFHLWAASRVERDFKGVEQQVIWKEELKRLTRRAVPPPQQSPERLEGVLVLKPVPQMLPHPSIERWGPVLPPLEYVFYDCLTNRI